MPGSLGGPHAAMWPVLAFLAIPAATAFAPPSTSFLRAKARPSAAPRPPRAAVTAEASGADTAGAKAEAGAAEGMDPETAALAKIAARFKMEVYDLDGGVVGLDSRDPAYGVRVASAQIRRQASGSLGVGLVEALASGTDSRGLVLVTGTEGVEYADKGRLELGDAVCAVGEPGGELRRVEGLNYDETVKAVTQFADRPVVKVVVKRLVERQPVAVRAVLPDGSEASFETLAGSNLRMALLQRDIRLYDPRTRRHDMPYAKGDCAGEGLCGTCLVQVTRGQQLLSPPDGTEQLITSGRPASWRAACRVVLGYENEGGEVEVRVSPQSAFEDEL